MSSTAKVTLWGIVGTVVGGLLLAYLTGFLTNVTKKADPRVTSFNAFDFVVAKKPYATISVQNEGSKTAEYCAITFQPGTVTTIGTMRIPVVATSTQFALSPSESTTVTLRTTTPLAASTALSFLSATASIQCRQGKSDSYARVLVTSF